MNIALVGYGKMGKEIEKVAIGRKHSIVDRISATNRGKHLNLHDADIAIEFSHPGATLQNITTCIDQKIPVVCGTTGWVKDFDAAVDYCKNHNGTFFYASNFSPGVNMFFKLNRASAKIMTRFTDYSVHIEEVHHVHKKDSPSGTAITLAEAILQNINRLDKWQVGNSTNNILGIHSERTGEVPGIHKIRYENDTDIITIRHDAKNRKGFAVGAVMVSEWIIGKSGYFTMDDYLNSDHLKFAFY